MAIEGNNTTEGVEPQRKGIKKESPEKSATSTKGVDAKSPVAKTPEPDAATKAMVGGVNDVSKSKSSAPVSQPNKETSTQQEPTTGKERRTARRDERQQKRYDNAVGMVERDAAKYGIDLNDIKDKLNRPMTDEERESILKGITDRIEDPKVKESVATFGRTFMPPRMEENVDLNKQKKSLIDSARRQRNLRWADALYAFGEGLQGKTADRNAFASTKLERDRNQQFQNYKNITEKNRQTKELWEDHYRTQMVNYLERQLQNKRLDDKQKADIQNAIDRMKVEERKVGVAEKRNELIEQGKYNTRTRSTTPASTKQPKVNYYDVYNQMFNGRNAMLNSLGNSLGFNMKDRTSRDAAAKAIINNLTTRTVDENGNVSLKLKPGVAELAKRTEDLTTQEKALQRRLDAIKASETTDGKTITRNMELQPELTKQLYEVKDEIAKLKDEYNKIAAGGDSEKPATNKEKEAAFNGFFADDTKKE